MKRESVGNAVTAVAVVVVVAAVLLLACGRSLFGGKSGASPLARDNSDPTTVAEKFVRASYTDTELALSLYAYDYKAYLISVYNFSSEAELFEIIGEEVCADVHSWDDVDEVWEESIESIEEESGELRIITTAKGIEYGTRIDTSGPSRWEIKGVAQLKEGDWIRMMYLSGGNVEWASITDLCRVTVECTFITEDDTWNNYIEVGLVKVDGSWGVFWGDWWMDYI